MKIGKFDFDKITESFETRGKTIIIAGLSMMVLMFVVALIVFFVALRGQEQVMVPDIVGKDLAVAVSELQAKALNTRVQMRFSDSAMEKGSVLEQNPQPGAIVKAGRNIDLVVSQGVLMNKVDNYVGQSLDEVKLNLKSSFSSTLRPLLTVKEPPMYRYDSSAVGTILEQSPVPGTEIFEPIELSFVVSQGPEKNKAYVPDLRGLSISDLMLVMQNSKIMYSFTSRAIESGEQAGRIVSQTPVAGSQVSSDTVVECVVPLPLKMVNGSVYGIFTQNLPVYPYPVKMVFAVISPAGIKTELTSFEHAGGTVTIPYAEEPGSLLTLNVLGKEVAQFEVVSN